ncbi:putative peroxiredoxin [Methanocella paludicola SANAE]|uniref:thioredoxin-dependent peroxiredoxin n=1 Tax=Methanocella paludicola (strain DSM 17711 / JCM 13418 / NBRC 101707 / SANAE) TaxID=304371 RepID=D1YW93_METPS|nr:peroxiredoxin family protein [Methanocella paludicola]BAI60715.1 putative peroxiredoxin [Methanocella paludicola SANAE]
MYRSMLGNVRQGSKAPMFSALDVRGDMFDTRAYLGRSNLVLFFYRGYWCATCREELLGLKGEYQRISTQDSEVVAISKDSIDEAKNMAVNLQLPYKVISDPDHHIIDMYDVYDSENETAFITLFLIDKAGVVRYKRSIAGLEDVMPATEIVNKLKNLGSAF